jgi:hypothetical protein
MPYTGKRSNSVAMEISSMDGYLVMQSYMPLGDDICHSDIHHAVFQQFIPTSDHKTFLGQPILPPRPLQNTTPIEWVMY